MLINVNKSLVARILMILVLVVGAVVSASALTSTPTDLTTVVSQVSSSANDAEENLNSGNVNLTSSDLHLGEDNHTNQLVGIRFINITIPHNAIIVSAYVEFEVAATDSNATSLTIRGQASDNAPTFSSTKNNISTRSRTTAQVAWNNIPPWSMVGVKWQTPNLSSIIQEIVNRPQWVNGNSIAVIINGSGQRTAKSYDGELPAAPKLIINYTIPTSTVTPTSINTSTPVNTSTPRPSGSIQFAVVGDYGSVGQPELDVANFIKSMNPDFIITTGDNNYPAGAASTIDANIGQYYHEFIHPYGGSYGLGATINRFFPALGNHDWEAINAQPYLNYFTLPGNERYYDFVWGPAHFFVIDSDPQEPDGISSSSVQAQWLQAKLAASTSPWKLVYMHHPPYSSSSNHGSTLIMQWSYQEWGASAVLAGHDHTYERILLNGIPYFVNGLGGHSIYTFGTPVLGSQLRYNADYGAMLVNATDAQITFQFLTRTGAVIDTYTLNKPATPTPAFPSTPTNTSTATATATSNPITIAPAVLSILRANTNPTSAVSIDLTVIFSEFVTGVDSNDFILTTSGGVTGASVTNVSGFGDTYTVTVNTGSGNGTLRLDVVDDNSIVYASSNPLGGAAMGDGNFTTGEVYTVDKSAGSTGGDTTGVFRPSNGLLYLRNSNVTGFADVAINYGTAGDYAVAGDWDGNGTATIGVYRNGSFYLRNSNTLGFADMVFAFGTPGDQPIAGDWNGDGVDTIGVFRTSTGQFLLRDSNSAGAADYSFYLGNVGDVGIAGDWTAKGFDTVGVFRPSNGIIFLKNTNVTGFADIALNYGLAGDQPVVGDWDGNGTDTIGVYRNAQFLLRNSNTIGFADLAFYLGIPGDMPIAGNWDGLP